MKKTLLTMIAFCTLSFLSACGNTGPGHVAIEMFTKVCKENKYDVMMEYVAPESNAIMGFGLQFMEKEGPPAEQDFCKQPITLVSETINGEVAEVILSHEGKPMHWKKVDGKWKMFIKK